MEPTIANALIGAGGAVAGAIVATILQHRLTTGKGPHGDLPDGGAPNIVGPWRSDWTDYGSRRRGEEILTVRRQKGTTVEGEILVPAHPGKRWIFWGTFNGRFLQLCYYPDGAAFQDYGCYFMEYQGDGSFEGHSVGYQWMDGKSGVSRHGMRRADP